jgi:hypothetical protein
MTKTEVMAKFKQEYLPGIIREYGDSMSDKVSGWWDYCFALHSNGKITKQQLDSWKDPF